MSDSSGSHCDTSYQNEGSDYNDEQDDDSRYDDEHSIPAKRFRLDSSKEYNSDECDTSETKAGSRSISQNSAAVRIPVGEKMLRSMGYEKGKGLGKSGQGIIEPVQACHQKSKRGLGYSSKSVQFKTKVEDVKVSLEEKPKWLENDYKVKLEIKEPNHWMQCGKRKLIIDDETEFCHPEVLHNVLKAKGDLDDIDSVRKVRSRANPFEAVGNGIFLNRAAMKMANMDKVFDYMFTRPKDKDGNEVIGNYDLLYFADVCAGPGGFSEYIFYRKKWRAKGFGFTLRDDKDFKLDQFFAGPCETFEANYGVPIDGDTGDGDIFKPENIEEFASFVMKNTDNKGVHFMMADGGFEVKEKSIQEILSKQLYLCQCLMALKIVRTNGNFVVKLFDIFTPFSVGLIYLIYRSFDRISIHKPNSSRPANSERYLICQYKREDCHDIANYLFRVNKLLCRRTGRETGIDNDILELVPLSILKGDENFFSYIKESINSIGETQVRHLRNLLSYSEDPELIDSRQDKFRVECLRYWDIPDRVRTASKSSPVNPEVKLKELFGSDFNYKDIFFQKPKLISNLEEMKQLTGNNLDWYWVGVENDETVGKLTFFLGQGRNNVKRFDGGKWVNEASNELQLPDNTLVYGEIVKEHVYDCNKRKIIYSPVAFHIVDGLFLGGEDIRNKHIVDRSKYCKIFAKSLNRSQMIYRVKPLYEFSSLDDRLKTSLKQTKLKNGKPIVGFDIDKKTCFEVGRLIFYCGSKGKWSRFKNLDGVDKFFKKHGKEELSVRREDLFLFEDKDPKEPIEDMYSEICADFNECFSNRRAYKLENPNFI